MAALVPSPLMTQASLLIVTTVSAQMTGQLLQKPSVLTVILESTSPAASATLVGVRNVDLEPSQMSLELSFVRTVLLESMSACQGLTVATFA